MKWFFFCYLLSEAGLQALPSPLHEDAIAAGPSTWCSLRKQMDADALSLFPFAIFQSLLFTLSTTTDFIHGA
jgi:hypothetical protein